MKEVIGRMFKSQAKEEFKTDVLLSRRMEKAIAKWIRIYTGNPDWVDEEKEIKTINFAKSVASETARLVCLDLSIKLDGSARADYIQTVVNNMFDKIREYVEKCCAYGTVVLKPIGKEIECLTPERFLVTETDGNGNIRGIIFFDYYDSSDKFYTKMEFHRFVEESYLISNRCYVSRSKGTLGEKIDIEKNVWKDIAPDVSIENLEKPLYAVLKTPMLNHIDTASPLGISIFAEAIEELKDLDIAYSRNAEEKWICLNISKMCFQRIRTTSTRKSIHSSTQQQESKGLTIFFPFWHTNADIVTAISRLMQCRGFRQPRA